MIIEEARKLSGVSVVFFYCRYQDTERNTFLALTRGLLSQLLHQDDALLPYLYDKASRSGQTTLSTTALGKELLETALKNSGKQYVIVDGIDECEKDERKDIVTTLENTWESIPHDDADSLRCLFISQDDSAARKDFAKMVSLKVTENDTKKDIRTFARSWSSRIKHKFDLSAERQLFVENMITEKAEGEKSSATMDHY